jgi:hypothetical protein
MPDPAINVIDHPTQPPTTPADPTMKIPGAAKTEAGVGNGDATKHASNGAGALTYAHAPEYFEKKLSDAERLLTYAAEVGTAVDANTRDYILRARAVGTDKWTDEIAANLLVALTTLAILLKPVTAESLRVCVNGRHHTVRSYWTVAICLAVFIVPVSVASFVSSAISSNISKDITTANDFAVKLTAQLEAVPAQAPSPVGPASTNSTSLPPGISRVDVITELQSFASTMRAIDTRARQLNWFILRAENDPFAAFRRDPTRIKAELQLPVPLPLDLGPVANGRIQVYQDVRSFAQSVVDDVSVFYGAITACILPVLYALLGTCAYLLRSFEQEMKSRTFTPSHSDSPRFLIAGIGGAIVGLFNNFAISQGASIPPLAIAFLVGYAVDVFFSFLEGLIQTFSKSRSDSNLQVATSTGAKS